MQIPSRKRDDPTRTKLTEADRRELLQLIQTSGYGVLLRIMEMKCILQDATLMNVPAHEEKQVLAEHRISVAKWEFFAEVQKQVEYEVNELLGPGQPEKKSEDEEIAAILDPLV